VKFLPEVKWSVFRVQNKVRSFLWSSLLQIKIRVCFLSNTWFPLLEMAPIFLHGRRDEIRDLHRTDRDVKRLIRDETEALFFQDETRPKHFKFRDAGRHRHHFIINNVATSAIQWRSTRIHHWLTNLSSIYAIWQRTVIRLLILQGGPAKVRLTYILDGKIWMHS